MQKVNKSGESLEGAAFRLEKLGDASFTPVEMGNESAISDFTFKCLDAGEYRLTEIKAPSNYIPLEEPILFTIIEESSGVFKIKLNTENSKVTLEEGTLTIKVANEKTVTTEITVDKKWFRADGTEFHPQDGEISYNLIQVLTTEGGESSEKIYKSGETLTSQDGWQKTYSNLPEADINGNGEKGICTYYVKEILIADYSTSYSNGSVGESEDPSAAALSSGTITVKNTEKMKFILPETGGTGRGILYIAGVFLLGISMFLLGNKNSLFMNAYIRKGDFCMNLDERDLKKIKSLHVMLKMPIWILEKETNKVLKSYESIYKHPISYGFKEKNISEETVQFYSGILNEIFLCLWYKV